MVDKDLREFLISEYPEAHIFDNPAFDKSVIVVTTDGGLVYDFDSMIMEMAEDDGITTDEALEFVDYVTLRTVPYIPEPRPVIMITLEQELYK